MALTGIEQLVTFGPFKMPHLQAQVDERLRQAFYSYLSQSVLPLLEGRITRAEGRVHSHYDQPQFFDLAAVRHRYYYEINLFSAGGHEEAWGEVDYDSDSASFTPGHVKPPGVKTLSELRELREAEQARREFQQRYRNYPGYDCPRCHSRRVARIAYGSFPIPLPLSVAAAIEAGTIRLGGSCIREDAPIWLCLYCETYWGCRSKPDLS